MLIDWKKRKNNKPKLAILGLLFVVSQLQALPDIASFIDCADVIFNSGFHDDSQASNGVGGVFPGAFTRSVFSQGQNRNYYISIPPDYDPAIASPLLLTWHGAGGAGTAPSFAIAHRDFWQPTGDFNNFIVVAQESTGATGGWVPATDFLILVDILDDMYNSYNIEQTRIYGHGFSSGGHAMHALMLQNAANYAAYIISAGVLEAFAGLNAPANASRIIPLYVSIGTNDTAGPNLNMLTHSDHIVFNNAGWVDDRTYWLDEFIGGHVIDAQVRIKSWAKICTFSKLQ
jgi:poly(3-hydroxybutyrate) depolymerase